MTDITIKYDHGQMLIHLEEFLLCRSISKVRKLIKLINRSDNPESDQRSHSVQNGRVGQYYNDYRKQD